MEYPRLSALKGSRVRLVKREESEDTDSSLADSDSTRLLIDSVDRRGLRGGDDSYASGSLGGNKSVRSFRRSEGSFSMDEFGEDEASPPAYSASQAARASTPSNLSSKSKTSTASKRRAFSVLFCIMRLVRSIGGLICLLLAYTFFGAWIMMRIEAPKEEAQKKAVFSVRENISEQLRNNTQDLQDGLINQTEWQQRADNLLLLLENTVHSTGVASTSKKKWTFLGSVLFCVTTYTTIGYGNIAPATKAGRIATMLYATIGIPLALIVLADLGKHLTVGFKFVWGFFRRYYYTGYCRKVRQRGRAGSYDLNESQTDIQDGGQGDGSGLQRQGSYRSTEPLARHAKSCDVRYEGETESGQKFVVKRNCGVDAKGNLTVIDSIRPGTSNGTPAVAVCSSAPHRNGDPRRSQSVERGSESGTSGKDRHHCHKCSAARRSDCELCMRYSESPPKTISRTGSHVFLNEDELAEDFKLPVSVAVGFIFVYIFAGAGMYTLWESWTYLESFYFVFITTSTIGFGDVLPNHPNFFLLSCVYTFLGLALVSMTINVIMEFLTMTIDKAKEKVDQAADKAVAKAKAAKGKLSEVGTLAKSKVIGIKSSRDVSPSPTPSTSKTIKATPDPAEDGKDADEDYGEEHVAVKKTDLRVAKESDAQRPDAKHDVDADGGSALKDHPSPGSDTADDTMSYRTADDIGSDFGSEQKINR